MFGAIMAFNELTLDNWKRAIRMGSLAQSSMIIAGERTAMMANAARSPLDGDYAELNRMIPEKIDAFSQAATAMAGGMIAMQRDAAAQWQSVMTGGMLGVKSAKRQRRMGHSFDRALVPIERQVSTNVKRLKAAKKR